MYTPYFSLLLALLAFEHRVGRHTQEQGTTGLATIHAKKRMRKQRKSTIKGHVCSLLFLALLSSPWSWTETERNNRVADHSHKRGGWMNKQWKEITDNFPLSSCSLLLMLSSRSPGYPGVVMLLSTNKKTPCHESISHSASFFAPLKTGPGIYFQIIE